MAWIREAPSLGGEGVEHYDGFLRSFDAGDVDPVVGALAETGQPTSLVCFSPDFTHPDADERARQVQRQRAAIDLTLRLGGRHCRTLSGQRHPGMTRGEGSRGRSTELARSIDAGSRASSCAWRTTTRTAPGATEFAQPEDIFLEIIERIDSPAFGVQHDPSNATVGGFDPVAFLEKVKHRVVSMHASDRYLAPGATIEDLRASEGAAEVLRPSCCTARQAAGSMTTTPSSASWPASDSPAGSRSRTASTASTRWPARSPSWKRKRAVYYGV